MGKKVNKSSRNLTVYKRPIGAMVYFDGWTEKLQERDIFPPSEKKSWERVHCEIF